MRTAELIALDVIVIAIVIAGAYAYTRSPQTTTTVTITTSVSTTSTSCTSVYSTTSTTTTNTYSSHTVNGSFTYSPTYPVVVESVQAVLTTDQNGVTLVTFKVLFENDGSSAIYIIGGCGSGLTSSTTNSSVIQKVAAGPLCLCPALIMQLPPGQNHTSTNPGCWSGYSYRLLKPGSATVELVQSWSGSTSSNSTAIEASFNFA